MRITFQIEGNDTNYGITKYDLTLSMDNPHFIDMVIEGKEYNIDIDDLRDAINTFHARKARVYDYME